MGIVSDTLDACAKAIQNWTQLRGKYNTLWTTDDQIAGLIRTGPSVSDVGGSSAIAIRTAPLNITTRTNQGIDWPIAIRIDAYLHIRAYRRAHDTLEEIIHAIYACKPDPGGPNTPTYVAACNAAGSPPLQVVSVGVSEGKSPSIQPAQAGETYLIATATFIFKGKTNPFPPNQ